MSHRVLSIGALAALIGAGAILRCSEFIAREAFWSDEAALAMNIVDRGWHEVGRPFVHAQVAPYLFVIGEKILVTFAGASEWSLRAWSLVTGVLLLPVLFAFTRLLHDTRAAFFAVATAATAVPLVHYSTELKPYGTDALISTLLAFAAVQALMPNERRDVGFRTLWIGGVVAPWLSLPAAFVLAGCGLALATGAWLERRPMRHWLTLAAVGCSWIASVAVHYLSFLHLQPDDAAFMQRYWNAFGGFAPFPPTSLADLRWYAGKFFYMFAVLVASVGHGERYVAAALWLGGIWLLGRKHKALPVLMIAPIALMVLAAAAHTYVLVDRLFLFLAPLFLAPCAIALSALAGVRPPVTNIAAVALVAALSMQHALVLFEGFRRPPLLRDIRTLVTHLRDRAQEGDRVCVEDRVAWVYEYYAQRAGLSRPFEIVQSLEPDAARARAEFAKLGELAGAPRVWVVVPTLGPIAPEYLDGVNSIMGAEQRMVRAFDALGQKIDMYDATNVRLYLFDLSASAELIRD